LREGRHVWREFGGRQRRALTALAPSYTLRVSVSLTVYSQFTVPPQTKSNTSRDLLLKIILKRGKNEKIAPARAVSFIFVQDILLFVLQFVTDGNG
jgi:hypothetical protein